LFPHLIFSTVFILFSSFLFASLIYLEILSTLISLYIFHCFDFSISSAHPSFSSLHLFKFPIFTFHYCFFTPHTP
jgi:hypothetical protein